VARKAAVIQADLRDARARLLADDLVAATSSLATDLAAEAELKQRRLRIEAELTSAREAEQAAEVAARDALPALTAAQETWYALAGLAERVASTTTIASERLRNAAAIGTDERPGRDPEAIEREAAEIRKTEASVQAEVAERTAALAAATDARNAAETAHAEAEKQYSAQLRAIADRREGLARLAGEVNTLRSRSEAAGAEIERLVAAKAEAEDRATNAKRQFAQLETRLAGLSAGESGLDDAYEAAEADVAARLTALEELQTAERAATAERGAAAARAEALALGLERRDGTAALLAAGDQLDGLLGSVAALISVPVGKEVAIAAALGSAADAIAVTGVDAAVRAFDHLKAEDLGRAGMLLGADLPADTSGWPKLPANACYAAGLVDCAASLRPAIERLLFKVAVVDDLAQGRELVAKLPDVTAVTTGGDLLSSWFAAGGSSAKPSLLEVQAALDETNEKLSAAQAEVERTRFAIAEAEQLLASARERSDAALARLHESDAEHAAMAEEAGELNQIVRSAQAEAGRLAQAADNAATARDHALANLSELETRLELASEQTETGEADPTERDHLGDLARAARAAEMEARLALRTVEERARAFAGRADSLLRAADAERSARAKAAARRELLRREAEVAAGVLKAAEWLAEQVSASRALAETERMRAQEARSVAETELTAVRQRGRELAKAFENLVDTVHADELARAQQQMKIDALAEKALAELGLEPEALVGEYGPEQLVPVLVNADGKPLTEDDPQPDPVPYVRAEQERRLRAAERDLAVLGKVNPLALEEFDALSERHTFLAEQLADLRKTRDDLNGIIADVDTRVQEVFAAAYADVEQAFEDAFARLFPGGEGRLVLTEPGEWLTTGVDVEARPAGKKVKRLSLLSGGERSLVAVAFLVALFKARPSPFYILDEVEAALDDTNLGRLLEIYEELRANSQLLVITHQKRTMEIADALYGVTMRSDGVSAVISQRLRDA